MYIDAFKMHTGNNITKTRLKKHHEINNIQKITLNMHREKPNAYYI